MKALETALHSTPDGRKEATLTLHFKEMPRGTMTLMRAIADDAGLSVEWDGATVTFSGDSTRCHVLGEALARIWMMPERAQSAGHTDEEAVSTDKV